MTSKKSFDERIAELDSKAQTAFEKGKQYEAQKRNKKKKKKAEERKKRNHLLIEIGAAVESLMDRPVQEGDDIRLLNFLKRQEANGRFFTKAMEKSVPHEFAHGSEVSSTQGLQDREPEEGGEPNDGF